MKSRRNAFTLVELLVVIGIVILLAAISVPVISSISKGADLGSAAAFTTGQLDLGRQTAASSNQSIEVRIYETKDSSGNFYYNALALYQIGEDDNNDGVPDSYSLAGKVLFLPRGCVFSRGAFSTLISEAPIKDQDSLPNQPAIKYSAFRFKPSGGADLDDKPASGTSWTLTILASKDAAATVLPPNYATISLNPVVGNVRLTRP